MIKIFGVIERITYYNPENGYSVLRFRPDMSARNEIAGLNLEGLMTVVGNLPALSPGEHVQLEGEYITHTQYGIQFQAKMCEKELPVTTVGIERYLGSGMIKGIGPSLAKRIVDYFKEDTIRIIEDDPNQLLDVPGIGPDRTEKIINTWEEQRQVKEIMLFLHDHQVNSNLAVKIIRTYGDQAIEVIKNNPYRLEQDVHGVGFKKADKIAQNLGLSKDHPSRIEAGVFYALNQMVNEGHVYSPKNMLVESVINLLEVDKSLVDPAIKRLTSQGRIISERIHVSKTGSIKHPSIPESKISNRDDLIYLKSYYYAETSVADRIRELICHPITPRQGSLFGDSNELSTDQVRALETAINHPVSILTGGPGTGKTTCLKALIHTLEDLSVRYALASPTGRAAKRLSEATERPASTIHRLLGYSPAAGFQFNDKHFLNIRFLIVDEASMLDLLLAYHLLNALKPGSQVLFVGDVDQLPSVGAGDVLRDIIDCGKVPVSRLSTIYRQLEDSQIVLNAHHINQGQMPAFSKTAQGDFFLFPADKAEKAADWIVNLVQVRIPDQFDMDPVKDIQVLSPLYRGAAGVDILNKRLQEKLNPPSDRKPEKQVFDRVFRVGDKVMQIRNNYDKDVYNGDIGFVKGINNIDQSISVSMADDRTVLYDFSEVDELILAYAISVHKSQGSEFPVVVIPVLTQHYIMLQRNLLYTAITRASRCCVLVGNRKALRIAINNNQIAKRFTMLWARIQEQ